MSYLVLARKYRPKTFTEVIGQDVVTHVLCGAISGARIGHAYLFSGPRGTGKTTSARLFAKALNCENGPTPDPCGTCERCVASDSGTEVDVIEIDAASNTGVDHIRDLRDQVAYLPLRARFKVYIVDEVHMLSKAAFNALLKTLEEPPPHVKFLLATTELPRLPDTIVSRCQVLRLAPIGEADITRRLDQVFEAESVKAEEGVTSELARRARGGMRDALSMADQLLALVGAQPQLADLERLSADGSIEVLEAIVDHIIAGDRAALIEALPRVEGGEGELLGGLLDYLRGCLLLALCGADAPMLAGFQQGKQAKERMRERGKSLGAKRLEVCLQELLHARERMRVLPAHGRLIVEVTLLDLCRVELSMGLAEIEARLHGLEERLASGAPAPPARPSTAPEAGRPAAVAPAAGAGPAAAPRRPASAAPAPTRTATRRAAPESSAQQARPTSNAEAWQKVLDRLKQGTPALAKILLARGKLVSIGDSRAVVRLSGLTDPERTMLQDSRNRKQAQRCLVEVLGEGFEWTFEDQAQTRPGREDPFTRSVADMFQGRIEE